DLLGHCLKPLANAIRAAHLELKTSQKLPKYGIPLLALNPEALGLITLGMLFNCITRSEFNEGTAARLEPAGPAYVHLSTTWPQRRQRPPLRFFRVHCSLLPALTQNT